jgi:hypothetical protein
MPRQKAQAAKAVSKKKATANHENAEIEKLVTERGPKLKPED